MEELINRLEELAAKKAWGDDDETLVVDDYAGGNIDDAFEGGFNAGRIDLARELLAVLKPKEA